MTPRTDPLTSRPRSDGAIRAGTVIGRYVVIERLGIGGMGVVLSAYDPKLDRKVAVKLLRAGRRDGTEAETAQQRLLREAQAMAKLDHPNVVTVHDVGMHEGTVFVAMEFVRGQTLRKWSEAGDRPRPWTEVVDVMRQAAQGLIAAHDAGLIHRDFKPDNVMIGEDGRVRVMDFGLVRAEREVSEEVPAVTEGAVLEPGTRTEEDLAADAMGRIRAKLAGMGKLGTDDVSGDADTLSGDEVAEIAAEPERAFEQSLTRTGALLGTPAYMSPEQIEAVAVDARTDQFAFCVTLFEALYGERPFAGETWTALAASILGARVVEPKADPGVPTWLRAVVMRGLSRKAADRFPDLRALVHALEPSARGSGRWVAAGLAGAAVVSLGVLAAGGADPCDGAADEIRPAWNTERAEAVRIEFAGLEVPYAVDTADRTINGLDAYAAAWGGAWEAACRATHDDGQSQSMLDRRIGCLDGRRRALAALGDVLVEGGAAVEHVVDAVDRLPDIEHCADLDALTSSVEPPPRAAAERVEDVRARLANAAALEAVGRYVDGVELAAGLFAEAEEIGYAPLVAEVAYRHGVLLDLARKPDLAAEALRRAAKDGRASGADDTAAAAEVRLIFVAGVRQRQAAEGRWWADHAQAAIERAGDDGLLKARRLNYFGATVQLDGETKEASTLLEEAVAAHEAKQGPDHPETLDALNNRALNLMHAGRLDDAAALIEELLRRARRRYGDTHPKVAEWVGSLANAQRGLGDLDASRASLDEALAELERAGEANTVRAAILTVNLGALLEQRGDHAGARDRYRAAREVFVRDLGEDHPRVALADLTMAALERKQGNHAEAKAALEQLAARQRKRLGPDHPDVGKTLCELGRAQIDLAATQEAIDTLVEAERIFSASGDGEWLEHVRERLAEVRGE